MLCNQAYPVVISLLVGLIGRNDHAVCWCSELEGSFLLLYSLICTLTHDLSPARNTYTLIIVCVCVCVCVCVHVCVFMCMCVLRGSVMLTLTKIITNRFINGTHQGC